jgi:membrane-associated protease RseP (regulator of RpoE activity)
MILLFLISLIICIVLHELSHLFVAKLVGCGIETISFGFGKPLFSFEYKKIRINITPILLGGYVKLKDELTINNDPDSFSNLHYRKKLAIALAGCAMNIISGLLSLFFGIYFDNYYLRYFGILSIVLGITNLLPIPCLDGGYPVFLPLCYKIYGKEKGMEKFAIINRISFIILMALNLICIPYLIYLIKIGVFK